MPVGKQFKAVGSRPRPEGQACAHREYLGIFPTAIDAAVAVAKFLSGVELVDCGSSAVQAYMRSQQDALVDESADEPAQNS